MNLWQVARQLQYLLQQQNWTGSSNVVFAPNSVLITPGPLESVFDASFVMPAALIHPMGATVDPESQEEPDYIEQELAVALAVANMNDVVNQAGLIGSQRTGQTSSVGRGLLEVEEELFNAIEFLNTDDGVVIQHRTSSSPTVRSFEEQSMVMREYLFRVEVTADRFYHPVINVTSA